MRPHARPVVLAVAWLFIAVSFGGCAGGRSRDPICEWADETASPLEPGNRAAGRHMNHDALVAEELAIRYADVRRGHRSGQFKGNDEYRQTREACLAILSRAIADEHGMTAAQVRDAVGRRDERLDASVLLLVAALFGFVVNVVAQRIAVRFLPDEPWPALIGTAVSALFVSAAGVIIGSVFASM